ncbi:hypothetical protein EWM64_g4315 [Hericium alpestre]|uniref:Uncharacterized protein n=1 Tax=Hericium alpestre TaxID=135208 RepID=A0A4Z0A0I2_9AGAM|nr:hypothetical protein EWM64_g4315 [Hericium alpestre]
MANNPLNDLLKRLTAEASRLHAHPYLAQAVVPGENVTGAVRLPVQTEEMQLTTAYFGTDAHALAESSQFRAPGDFAFCLETDLDMIVNAGSVSAARESGVQHTTERAIVSSAEERETPGRPELSPTPELSYPASPSVDGTLCDEDEFTHSPAGPCTAPMVGEADSGVAERKQEDTLNNQHSIKTKSRRNVSRKPMSEEARRKLRAKIKETKERGEDAANAFWEHLHGVCPGRKGSKREHGFRLGE